MAQTYNGKTVHCNDSEGEGSTPVVATNVTDSAPTIKGGTTGAMYRNVGHYCGKTWANNRNGQSPAELKTSLPLGRHRRPSHGTCTGSSLLQTIHRINPCIHCNKTRTARRSIHAPRPLILYCVFLHIAAPHKRDLGLHKICPLIYRGKSMTLVPSRHELLHQRCTKPQSLSAAALGSYHAAVGASVRLFKAERSPSTWLLETHVHRLDTPAFFPSVRE